MKIMAFNCKGLANPSKKSPLKRLVDFAKPNVIFLQETMGSCQMVKNALEALLARWTFEAINARGRSGGLTSRWNERRCKCENV